MPRLTAFTLACLSCASFLADSPAAYAQAPDTPPNEDACVTAYDRAQSRRKNLELLGAKSDLQVCARAECPQAIASDCSQWLTDIATEIPSVVVSATGLSGQEVLDVVVSADGVKVTDRLGVKALELDPGEHRLAFEHAGQIIERTVLLRVGQRNLSVEVAFGDEAPMPEPPAGSTVLPPSSPGPDDDGVSLGPLFWAGIVTTGVGVVVAGAFGGWAIANRSKIDDDCAVGCSQDDIDSAAIPAHVATGGFILAGVGAALTVVGLFVGGSDGEPTEGAWIPGRWTF